MRRGATVKHAQPIVRADGPPASLAATLAASSLGGRSTLALGSREKIMFATNRFVTLITVVSVAFISSGCATTYRTVGPYEVVSQGGGLLCQPRLEFYFTGSSSGSNKEHIYLGACGTSQGLMRELNLSSSSGDRSCFGIAEDGASMVYLHKPRICGVGDRGARKPGRV